MPPLVAADAELQEIPVTPSAEDWRALTPREREQHLDRVVAAMQHNDQLMGEGRPHFRAKVSAASTLGDHFDRVGRHVYLACELPVLYPGEPACAPDLMAVLDVQDPGDDDTRTAWVVADEGRGLDLALEILYSGNKEKDLVTNLVRYARLGIPEYFVYDRKALKLYGYRLQAGRYRALSPRLGLLRSDVLDLSLGVLDGRLRFLHDGAVIPEAHELRARLERLMLAREDELELREFALAEAEAQIAARDLQLTAAMAARQESERQRAESERQRVEADRQRAEAELQRAESDRQRVEAEARAAALQAELDALRARLTAQG